MVGMKVLFVESDKSEWSILGKAFVDAGHDFSAAADGLSAFKKIVNDHFDLVISALNLTPMSGLDLLKRIKDVNPSIPVVLLSADAGVDEAVEAMKLGAEDFIMKPLTAPMVEALTTQRTSNHRQMQQGEENGKYTIITQNAEMNRLLQIAKAVSDSQAGVFIQGESGTGKELFARYVHHCSDRDDKPFIAINCAALPETLLESELFGHEKGAFTGAIALKKGKFELAHRGTLLLDEISEMDYGLQSKLLRALQEREIDRIGGTESIPIDVRIIATTNRDIEKHIESGKFREDLFYRLNVIPIHLPPLRERPDDIPLLSNHFIKKYNLIDGRNVKGLTDGALDLLLRMPWKGNVRELENITERAILLCKGDMIAQEDFHLGDRCKPNETARHPLISSPPEVSLKEMEKSAIFHALDRTNNNRTHAANILGISVRTLRNKLNEYREKMEAQP